MENKKTFKLTWYEKHKTENGHIWKVTHEEMSFETIEDAMKFYRQNYNYEKRDTWALIKQRGSQDLYTYLGC